MKMRNWLLIIVSIAGIIALASMDIYSNGKLTNGFLGMIILLIGTVIYPSYIELIKESKKRNK